MRLPAYPKWLEKPRLGLLGHIASSQTSQNTSTSAAVKLNPPSGSVATARSQSKAPASNPLVVVLDMDECLLHTTGFIENPAPAKAKGRAEYRQAEFRPDLGPASAADAGGDTAAGPDCLAAPAKIPLLDGGTACVSFRPGLANFLRELRDDPKFEVHVFTAALPEYAGPVLDWIERELGGPTMLGNRHYRSSCNLRCGLYGKELAAILPNYAAERSVMVDNNPRSFWPNPEVGLLVSSWYKDEADRGLDEALERLKQLRDEPDIRPQLRGWCGPQIEAGLKPFAHRLMLQASF